MKLETSLENIKSLSIFPGRWQYLLECLGQTHYNPDLSVKVSLRFILEKCGISYAIRAMDYFNELEKASALYALFCAKRVRHLMRDERSTNALDVARLYLDGIASEDELKAANRFARDAYHDKKNSLTVSCYAEFSAFWGSRYFIEGAYFSAEGAADAANQAAFEKAGGRDNMAQATKASIAASEAERTAQEAEFKRMLDIVESGQEYTIN
ncbi:MAG: hypothetical protein EBX50_01310 [Chitinophagia bacterium]|nr:hypothetical protein [Chitinophagia bacterium]